MASNNDEKENRFTLADYDYDRNEEYDTEPHAESSHQATSSSTPFTTSNPSYQLPRHPHPAHAHRPNRTGIGKEVAFGERSLSGGTLRLHEGFPPSSSTSTTFSPPYNTHYLPSGPSTSTNELISHPSYSSQHPLTSDLERGYPSALLSPGYDEEDRRSIMSDLSEKNQSRNRDSEVPKMDMTTAGPIPLSNATRRHGTGRWWNRLIPSTTLTRILLATILIEAIINLAIEGNILSRFRDEATSSDAAELEVENKRRLPIYLIIFGLAHLWELVLTVIAIRTKNTIQVIAVTAFNYAFLGYAIIQIYELRKILGDNLSEELTGDSNRTTLLTLPLNVLTALIIAVVAVSCLVLTVLSYYLQREFGWLRYRFLGADLMIREYYFKLQVFECICYFSAFFCAGFGIQFIWLVLNPEDTEYIVTWIAFPLLLIFLVIGRFAAKHENRYFMASFLVGLFAGCAYFIYKLVRIWQQDDTKYYNLAKSLTTFDALSLISLVACAMWGVMVWMNFGKGLKSALASKPGSPTFSSVIGFWRTGSRPSEEEKGEEMTMSQRRISID
ncbi:hypothetical protein CI109_102520 [Kwoniella shandongensis]|uniref:Uncharacterized protein n=1 Tax=Kwoniella shandongensis TaxID=1734106 RepID=A0A5M6BUG4_9TREE|nr:uncharacterized protein CI109_005865 [Kwoniella shandongensis]KAA5525841.1 hypothetical protein CI109_005865 [Kwoniella shandongensis]